MPTYSGIFRDDTDTPVGGRIVRAYRRDTGALLGEIVSSDGSPEPGDADYASVALLLNCSGASISDSSSTTKTLTLSGGVGYTSTNVKFAPQSINFDGVNDHITTNHASFAVGSGDFTVEMWVYLMRASGSYDYLFHLSDAANDNSGIYVRWADGGFGNALQCAIEDTARVVGPTRSQAANDWHLISFERKAGTCNLFWDGVLTSTSTNGTASASTNLRIGASMAGNYAFQGLIGGFRFTPGLARHSASYAPDTKQFPAYVTGPATQVGQISLTTPHTGEVQLVYLDDAAGATYNDKIMRVLPA